MSEREYLRTTHRVKITDITVFSRLHGCKIDTYKMMFHFLESDLETVKDGTAQLERLFVIDHGHKKNNYGWSGEENNEHT